MFETNLQSDGFLKHFRAKTNDTTTLSEIQVDVNKGYVRTNLQKHPQISPERQMETCMMQRPEGEPVKRSKNTMGCGCADWSKLSTCKLPSTQL